MSRWLSAVFAWLFNTTDRRPTSVAISVDNLGLSIAEHRHRKTNHLRRINWDAIKAIYVYKKDLYTVDQICLRIETTNNDAVEINEAAQGWDELIGKIPTHLPTALTAEAWFKKVAFPAFDKKLTKIYPSTSA